MTKPLISIRNFQMRFGGHTVIEDLSFEVRRGEVFGFLGANGSGKTTTLRALLGIYTPTKGELLIDGQAFTPQMSGFLGYLPEERGLYKKERVLDTMVYFGRLKGLPPDQARAWSLEFLGRVDLADKAMERLDKLSGGQQQKVQLGVTIMNQPRLLILDEPTKGFDPVNRRLMLDIIDERRREGATIVLVTHQMEEVERLCDRIVLLKDGKRRLYGTVDEITEAYGSSEIELRFEGTLPKREKLYSTHHVTSASALLTPKEGVTAQMILADLAKQPKLSISRFELKKASLDDVFVHIYQEGGDRNA